MSRRDTIIVAVLVNAALLMVLFATAMRSDKPEKPLKSARGKEIKVGELAQAPAHKPATQDLLGEFVSSAPTLAESGAEENIFTFEEAALAFTAPAKEVVEVYPKTSSASTEEVNVYKPKNDEHFVNVTVKKGDFLEKIAKSNNTTVAAIMSANNLSSSQLKIGQVLKVPLSGKAPTQQKAPSSTVASEIEYYVVKEGDNPWLIASRNRINLEELLRINGLDEQKAKRLRPGDKLKIR